MMWKGLLIFIQPPYSHQYGVSIISIVCSFYMLCKFLGATFWQYVIKVSTRIFVKIQSKSNNIVQVQKFSSWLCFPPVITVTDFVIYVVEIDIILVAVFIVFSFWSINIHPGTSTVKFASCFSSVVTIF